MRTAQYARAFPAMRVNAVCPGFTATDFSGHRGVQTVAEGAEIIVRMATVGPDGPSERGGRAGFRVPALLSGVHALPAGGRGAPARRCEVEVRFAPFQLRPDASPAGESLFEVHARERGEAVAREIATSSIGGRDGLRLDFRWALFTTAFDAHRLLASASEQDCGEAMAERLFRAYFTDGLNIADRATLTALADEVGVATPMAAADSLHAQLDRVHALGIDVPPVFRFPRGTITGSGECERFRRALRELT